MYPDGQSTPETHARVAAHLIQCRRCRRKLEQVAMARTVLRELPLAESTGRTMEIDRDSG